MTKFNKGDLVRRSACGCNNMRIGSEYLIAEVDGTWIYFKTPAGAWREEYFELVKTAEELRCDKTKQNLRSADEILKDFVTESRAYQSPEIEECEIFGPLLKDADAYFAHREQAHANSGGIAAAGWHFISTGEVAPGYSLVPSRRISDLLEANNRYLQDARDARAEVQALTEELNHRRQSRRDATVIVEAPSGGMMPKELLLMLASGPKTLQTRRKEEGERLLDRRNELTNSFGGSSFHDNRVSDEIDRIDLRLAELQVTP